MLFDIFCWIGIAFLSPVVYCGVEIVVGSLYDLFKSDDEDLKQ